MRTRSFRPLPKRPMTWPYKKSSGRRASDGSPGEGQQRLAHPDTLPLTQLRAHRDSRWGEGDDGGAMLKPTHLLTFVKPGVTGDDVGAPVPDMQQHVQKVQADTGHQNRR